jgi:predicted amidohydrolase YtcJ
MLTRVRRAWLTLTLALAVLAPRAARAQASGVAESVDLLLSDGKVITLDDRFTIAEAVAVRGGRIVAVGDNTLLYRVRAGRTIDLRGHVLLPGFDDTAVRVNGVAERNVDLSEVRTIEELKERIRRRALILGKGEWVTGSGWSEDDLAEKRAPTRAELDEAAPVNPVLITRAGGHSAAANSRALALAGIARGTVDPEGGAVDRDSTGAPTGLLREGASTPVQRLIPRASRDELRASRVAFLQSLLALGITSFVEARTAPEDYAEWEAIYREMGDSLPRASIQIYPAIGPGGDVAPTIAALRAFGRHTGAGGDRLRVGALKVFVDGGFTSPAAATLQPYRGLPGYRGTLLLSDSALHALASAAQEMGWQLGWHAAGDAAIVQATRVLARVAAESPRADHRHFLDQFSLLPPDSVLARMAAARLAVSLQPNFTYTLEGRYRAYLDSSRMATNNPVRSLLKHGIPVAFGSDNLPVGPLLGISVAATRTGKSGAVYGAREAVSVREAIRAYTRAGAWLTHEERIKGTIEPGKLADLIVLSDDPFVLPPIDIRSARVLMTILGGRVVYQREALR